MNRDQERAIEWDVFQIHNRMYILGDAGDHEGYANSFTEDGVSVYEGIALNGRAEILQSRFDSYEPRFYRSFVANCTVTVIDEKKRRSRFLRPTVLSRLGRDQRWRDPNRPTLCTGPPRQQICAHRRGLED